VLSLAFVVAWSAVVSGCTRKGPHIVTQGVQSGQPLPSALQPILDRRARALLHGDQNAYLADLDQSNARLLDHERMVFANLRQLAPVDVRFALDRIVYVTTTGTGTTTYEFQPVVEVIQLQGDAGPPGVAPGESFIYDATLTRGRLVVTDIVPVSRALAGKRLGLSGPYADAPWDVTPLRVVNAGEVQLAADSSVTDLDQYVAAAENQVQQIEGLWGARPRFPKYVLFLTRDTNALASWFEPPSYLLDREGFEQPEEGVRTNGVVYTGQYVGTRVVVNLSRISQFGDDPVRVVRHELTHAVTARQMAVSSLQRGAVVSAPTWVVEGFAVYVETLGSARGAAGVRSDVLTGVEQGRFGGGVPTSVTFQVGDSATVSFNYDLSSTVFTFIERMRGQGTAVDFYSRAVHESETAGQALVAQPDFDGICRDELGMSASDFLDRWASFVRSGAL
jgi:hypothetical protein